MRLQLFLTLTGLAIGDRVGGIQIDYDQSLEGRVGIAQQVEASVGELFVKAQFSESRSGTPADDAIDMRSLISRNPAFDMTGMGKRQNGCNPGYGYCANFNRCCPEDHLCCSYGYCLPPARVCCPEVTCPEGTLCCGRTHCYPEGGECCSDESYCNPGNHCFIYPDSNARRCCTDRWCTAVVLDDGRTSYATTSTTTRTITTTSTQYYYWTVTWWYWYYYWSYSIEIEASIVTSTRSTTSSTLSVFTTDAAAATDYFNSLSSDLELPTPEAAVTLESLAGQTSFDETEETSTTEREPEETSTAAEGTTKTEEESEETSSTSSSTTTQEDDTETVTFFTAPTEDAGGEGAAATNLLYSGINGWAVSLVAMGVGTGVLAILL